MGTNIPMSTEINKLNTNDLKEPFSDISHQDNSLDYVNEINEQNEQDNGLDNINLDEILSNQGLMDNKFVNYLKENSDLDGVKDPSVHIIASYYGKQMLNDVFPSCKNSSIVTLIRFVHIVGITFIGMGYFLPRKFLPYHILFCMHALIGWDLLDDQCYMTMIIQKIKGESNYKEFIPADMIVCRAFILMGMLFSIIGIALPNLSLFNVLSTIFSYLRRYN